MERHSKGMHLPRPKLACLRVLASKSESCRDLLTAGPDYGNNGNSSARHHQTFPIQQPDNLSCIIYFGGGTSSISFLLLYTNCLNNTQGPGESSSVQTVHLAFEDTAKEAHRLNSLSRIALLISMAVLTYSWLELD